MLGSRETEVVIVVGARRTGKTRRAKSETARILSDRLAAGDPARGLIVVTPVGDWHPAGAVYVRDMRALIRARMNGARVIVMAGITDDIHPLEELRGLVVDLDEAHNYMSARSIAPSFRRLICESGHTKTDVVLVTQRPGHLNPVTWANVTKAILFPIIAPADRRAVEEGLGIDLPAPSAWRPVALADGSTHPTAREPLIWPDDFAT